MEDTQDENVDPFFSQCSSEMGDTFGNPEVLPRVGDEFQAEIHSLIAECDCLQLINTTRNSESTANNHESSPLGLPIPLMWSAENINGIIEFEKSEESQIISNNEYPELKVEPVDARSGNWKIIGVHSNIQQAVGSYKMEADLVLPQESATKMDQMERGLCPLPGSLGALWTDVEQDSFLLGLYIYGKNLVAVKKFVESKEMGDILSFYYGEFYRSKNYCRWSECRKLRSRRSIYGQKMFTGWRQQELLSRLLQHISQECQSTLLEVSRAFAEGKISFEEYVSTLKSTVGINLLVEAVGIGKGKHDLTGIAMEPVKPNQSFSVRPEIPTGKACASLTSTDIIRFLTGGFRLSKARSNDLFWEAVWPRLLARGWHSEQPKDNGVSGSKRSLVFLIPGVKKFSRRLVKGNHYFDSVSDVLNKVASEPRVLELEVEAANGSQHEEGCGRDPSSKQDQDGLSNKQHHIYLRPCNLNRKQDLYKFTIVDTSLACAAEQPKVKELRSLSIEAPSILTSSSLSSETEEDTSEDSQENKVETNTSNAAEDATDGRTCVYSSDCASSPLNNGANNSPDPVIVVEENVKNKNRNEVNDKEERKIMKFQFNPKVKSGCSKYLVPIKKQASNITRDLGESSCSTKHMTADRKLIQDDYHYMPNLPDACEGMVFQSPPHNLSSASSLAKDSPAENNEGIVGENCIGKEASPEKLQSPKLIDLNIPPISPDFAVDEHIITDMEQNNDNLCVNNSSFLSGTDQQPEPFKLSDAGAYSGEQPTINSRRQSTRNRPLTTKALEALESGFFSMKKKRKGANVPESNAISRSSRRVRRKTDVKTTSEDGAINGIADSRTADFLQGLHDN